MQNMMWAIRIVRMFEREEQPLRNEGQPVVETNIVSSDAPSTTSGVDIGRKMSMFVAPRARK